MLVVDDIIDAKLLPKVTLAIGKTNVSLQFYPTLVETCQPAMIQLTLRIACFTNIRPAADDTQVFVLGLPFFHDTYTIFDREKKRIGLYTKPSNSVFSSQLDLQIYRPYLESYDASGLVPVQTDVYYWFYYLVLVTLTSFFVLKLVQKFVRQKLST